MTKDEWCVVCLNLIFIKIDFKVPYTLDDFKNRDINNLQTIKIKFQTSKRHNYYKNICVVISPQNGSNS